MSFIFKKIISTLISLVMLAIFCPFVSSDGYTAKDPDALKLNFAVVSDCHIEGNNMNTYKTLGKILADAKASKEGNDAMVFLGDNTMNGQNIESIFFYGTVNAMKPAKQYINVIGNHDIGNGEGDFEKLSKRFTDYSKTIMGKSFNNAYYYKVINGCYFVVLATEEHTVNDMALSDTQLEWLKGVLDEAKAADAPIFVFSHHPANYLKDRPWYALTDILNDYDNLLFIAGHTHVQLNEGSVYKLNGVNCINMPKTTEHVDYSGNTGAQIEVYEDEIIVRMRNFYEGNWIDGYEFSYPVK